MMLRTWFLVEIDGEASLISAQPLTRSIISHSEAFEHVLLEFLPQVNLRQLA